MKKPSFLPLLALLGFACTNPISSDDEPLFNLLTTEQTGITFQNSITEGPNTNVLMYEYFYNGGGVATGDLNGDKLDDIYFTSNLGENKLYLNKGNLKFEDITSASGAEGRPGPWRTGVVMADVNADGRLDIFVSHSGNLPAEKKINELFINQGNNPDGVPTFSEQSYEYGLRVPMSTTNAYFFDYDIDGDLDLFLLNHNIKSLPVLNEANSAEFMKQIDPMSGCKLFMNEGNKFSDITEKAGINSSPLSYGLGAGIADINQDGWPDLYVSNDYTIPDYLYINQKNGTFKNEIQERLTYTSQFSMGNDVADINNDARPDIFTLDMLPESNARQKLLLAPDNYDKFDMTVRSGFYKQFMRNMLHINQEATFPEIGQLAGVSNTDWSWAALFADYDNDGWKDLYITNGYLRDYTNLDFLKYMNNFQSSVSNVTREDVLNLVQQMPSSNLSNYIFHNNKDLTFRNTTKSWGLTQQANSNGAAFSDLDNDGDLDLVVNNINQPAFVYQNNSQEKKGHNYLKISLKGKDANTQGIGSKVVLYCQNKSQYLEQMPSRGYQSSVSNVLHFGMGTKAEADSIKVIWPDGSQEIQLKIKANQWLILDQKNANKKDLNILPLNNVFEEVVPPIEYTQPTVTYNDFKRQLLLTNPQSQVGPCLAKGDANNDGLEDVFVGGGNGNPSALFLQTSKGGFIQQKQNTWTNLNDVSDALFFDADGDKDLDLYVCHGGYANFLPEDPLLQDYLYFNDGKGNFTIDKIALPTMYTSTSCVRVADINGDYKPDLFVGGRVKPGSYPETPQSYLLLNQGKGQFKDVTEQYSSEIGAIGMVTDAAWVDVSGDKNPELIVVGEWLTPTVFEVKNGKLVNTTDRYFSKNYYGWWNTMLMEDFNGDGLTDLLIGNLGLNSQHKASDTMPVEVFYKDFDQNGRVDPMLCTYIEGRSYPYLTRDELIGQMPMMGKKFTDYKSFSNAILSDIFDKNELENAKKLTANHFATTLFIQNKNRQFEEVQLPTETQFAPIHALLAFDFDKDGKKDIFLAGNQTHSQLRVGHYEANAGLLLRNNGNNVFKPVQESGFSVRGEVRSVLEVDEKIYLGIHQKRVVCYGKK